MRQGPPPRRTCVCGQLWECDWIAGGIPPPYPSRPGRPLLPLHEERKGEAACPTALLYTACRHCGPCLHCDLCPPVSPAWSHTRACSSQVLGVRPRAVSSSTPQLPPSQVLRALSDLDGVPGLDARTRKGAEPRVRPRGISKSGRGFAQHTHTPQPRPPTQSLGRKGQQ